MKEIMADTRSTSEREGARNRAQNHFAVAAQRDTLVKQMISTERAALDARTAKLRALRLAKEEADRIAAADAPHPEAKAPVKRKRALRVR